MSEQEQELTDSTEVVNQSPIENVPDNRSASDSDIIEVRLKTLEDREATVLISKTRTLFDLVNAARNELDINTGNQRIIFQGRVLDPAQSIESAGITNGHTVHLVNRTNSTANERPNVAADRQRQITITDPSVVIRRSPAATVEQRDPQAFMVLPPIRVPATISNVPVMSSRFNESIFYQETMPLRLRTDHQAARQIPRDNNIPPFSHDPHVITWTIKVMDGPIYFPRDAMVQIATNTVMALPFLDATMTSQIRVRWTEVTGELRIDLPQIAPHIPSPALEKLDFMCFWTENLKRFLDKVNESDGLVAETRKVLEMAKSRVQNDGLPQNVREERMNALDRVVKDLELLSAELSHIKDYERERFKRHNTEEYRSLKQQEHPETQRNPRFFMRHALDVDLTSASREFRKQQERFAVLEDLMDDLMETGAMRYARDIMSNNRDYRYQALSMFFHYMQRMRHQVSHIAHVQSELDISFLTPNYPQRLLPQYASNFLTVPLSHAATIVFQFVSQRDEISEVPITTLIEPPRVAADVGNRANGDWPYLPFNPPSVHTDAVLQSQRRMADPRPPRTVVHMHTEIVDEFPPWMSPLRPPTERPVASQDSPTFTIQELVQAQHEQVEMILSHHPSVEAARVRVSARPRRVVTTGDAPSVPVETMPPPVDWTAGANRRPTTARNNSQAGMRGPETQTLASLPVPIESSELQRIARNIASRYREDALRRIAANLTARFNEESWDTRLQSMPLCTLRESIALCLELLVSSGSSVNESKDLMLALIRDEEVLVRAIAESVKSLFGRGEFPTHLARIIMPRNETASARTDYESVDGVEDAQSDEYDAMVVRVPSDISQPQSGDLRAIRDRRASRRQFLENRRPIPPTTSSSTVTTGPSFNPEDAAEIRAGRLPLSNRPARRAVVREAAQPAAPAASANRANSPSQMFVSFTSTMQQGNQPSSSSTASATFNINPITYAATRIPAQNTPPPPGSENGGVVSTPPPSAAPRTSSAPASVTNSPSRAQPSRNDSRNGESTSDEVITPRIAARAARAQIDHLAASYSGTSPSRYLPGTSNLRTARTMPPPEPSIMHHRPMVAIDPFMICGNRHCEIHRIQNPTALPDADRYSLQSLQPDPEFESHIGHLRPSEGRRPEQTSEDDEDYNYNILRSTQGDVGFHNLDGFCRFIRTICRSIMSHVIDTDTLITLNMNNVSGYVAANHQELMNMVRRHVNMPYSARVNNIPFRPGRASSGRDARGHPRAESPIPDRNEIFRQVTEQEADVARENRQRIPAQPPRMFPAVLTPQPMFLHGGFRDMDVLISQQISAYLTFIVDYMENTNNPRPTGVFGFLLELTFRRFTRHDFALLPRRSSAQTVLAEYGPQLRTHILSRYLENRRGLPNAELHRLADNIANADAFFSNFMIQNPLLRQTISLQTDGTQGEQVQTIWAFRQIEIALIKAILALAQMNLDQPNFIRITMLCFDKYLYRNLLMFWRLADREPYRQKTYMHRIADFFASIRFNRPLQRMDSFLEGWHHSIDYWFEKYHDIPEDELTSFLRRARRGQDWNDAVEASTPAQPSTSVETPITATAPSTSNAVANPNPRKRNHDGSGEGDDGVDVVAPMMTSLSTSSPSTSIAAAANTAVNEDVEMQDATQQ